MHIFLRRAADRFFKYETYLTIKIVQMRMYGKSSRLFAFTKEKTAEGSGFFPGVIFRV
jgi:hypothetical protein